MKHLEVRQKYSAGSSGDETLRFMLDKLHNIKNTHLKIVSVEYLSFKHIKLLFLFWSRERICLKLTVIVTLFPFVITFSEVGSINKV